MANIDALSVRRQQTLPARCTVYDLFNFSTEVATHHANPDAGRRFHALVGSMLQDEYDLENSRDTYAEFEDLHISSKLSGGLELVG